ncbi:MAG TPA: hypothetical protein ENN21_07450 [Spirochaetes bacterium]|nr:hypothetical protein [Spirochaetota bacterium]
MKKHLIGLLFFCVMASSALAETDGKKPEGGVNYIPLLTYGYLSLDSQSIHSPGAGLVVKSEDVMFVGLYVHHSMEEPLVRDYPADYHSIDTLLDGKKNRHQYLGIFKSESDQPVYGGLNTFQAAVVYGYEVTRRRNFSFVLGGGLAVSDFGIELSNGDPWPVLPIPLVRLKYKSEWIDTSFDFLTTPNLNVTVGPTAVFE